MAESALRADSTLCPTLYEVIQSLDFKISHVAFFKEKTPFLATNYLEFVENFLCLRLYCSATSLLGLLEVIVIFNTLSLSWCLQTNMRCRARFLDNKCFVFTWCSIPLYTYFAENEEKHCGGYPRPS